MSHHNEPLSSSLTGPDGSEPKKFSAQEILAIAYEARNLAGRSSREKLELMRTRYPDFWYRYPRLLDMCCEDGSDMEQLTYMVNLLAAIDKQTMSMEEASREVHQKLADRFVPAAATAAAQKTSL